MQKMNGSSKKEIRVLMIDVYTYTNQRMNDLEAAARNAVPRRLTATFWSVGQSIRRLTPRPNTTATTTATTTGVFPSPPPSQLPPLRPSTNPRPLPAHPALQAPSQLRNKHPNTLLILAILRILPSRDLLRQPRRALKESEVSHGPGKRPVEIRVGDVAGPLVQHHPDGLLGGEVGVAAPGPQAGCVEAAVEVGPGVGWWRGGGFEVGLFGGLEVCWAGVC